MLYVVQNNYSYSLTTPRAWFEVTSQHTNPFIHPTKHMADDIRNVNPADSLKDLHSRIKGINIAMLTTVSPDGDLHARPMATQEAAQDGKFWFLTRLDSGKKDELSENSHVNLAYADAGKNTYVSISGKGRVTKDYEKAKELWMPLHKAWFPEGLDDDNLGVLCVEAEYVEYWDDTSNKMVQLFKMATAALGGPEYRGEHGEIHLKD